MNSKLRQFFCGPDSEDGQALILFAIVMLAMLFAIGLAIDAGELYSAKRTEQEAADAAAFAGAVVLYQGGTGAMARAAAITDATINGYTDGVNQTTVTVNWPPTSGAYSGDSTHVEVIITRQVRTSLVPAEAQFNPVRARGVAGAENLNSGYAIMALNRGNTCESFDAQSGAELHLVGGGILVNSSSSCAAENDQNNSAKFTIETPFGLDVHGGASGYWTTLTPPIPVNAGYPQVGDPFAGFPRPDPAALGLPTCPTLAACRDLLGNQMPGLYTTTLGESGGGDLHLNPGVYILTRGFDTSGNASVHGTGVFLFNTYSTYPSAPGVSPSCSMVDMVGNSSADLAAMTTGTWANLLVYQDPHCTTDVRIRGNGVFDGTGSIYIPNGAFVFDGENATLHGSQLIAQTVDVQNGNITIDYDPHVTAQPILPRLAE